MVLWLMVIIALAVFQIIALKFSFPDVYTYISTILVLMSAIGLLYRANHIQKKKD